LIGPQAVGQRLIDDGHAMCGVRRRRQILPAKGRAYLAAKYPGVAIRYVPAAIRIVPLGASAGAARSAMPPALP
jgi:hypothetical protein